MKPLVVNVFGAPCAGKSTLAAGLFHYLKKDHIRVELVSEYAKELTFEERWNTLRDQIGIFAEQRSRIERCLPHCEVIVTDCPILLGANYYPELFPDCFRDLLLWAFNQHNTLNIFLVRAHEYSTHGRRQSAEESDALAIEMMEFLDSNGVEYVVMPGSDEGLELALAEIERLRPRPD